MTLLNSNLGGAVVSSAGKRYANSLTPEIIEALKAGDHMAFDIVFLALYSKVKAFIRVLTKSEDVATELSQQLFIDLWLKKERLDSSKNFNAYIYTMARNSTINYLKSRNCRDFCSYEFLNSEDSIDFNENICAMELELLINLTVKRMPQQRRRVYELSRNANKDNDSIAKELNISKKVVEKHIRLALGDIREVIRRFTLLFFC